MRLSLASLIGIVCLLGGGRSAEAVGIINGDFETGDLTGWTAFDTPTGTAFGGISSVGLFDTNNDGTSTFGALFRVGQTVLSTGLQGGGIFQSVVLPAGTVQIGADIAANTVRNNAFGGFFELLFDGVVVDSVDFGLLNQSGEPAVKYSTLSAVIGGVSAGAHEIRFRITRPAGFRTSTFQRVDNVFCTMLNAPPTIVCPADVILECPADTGPDNTGFATATDDGAGEAQVLYGVHQQTSSLVRINPAGGTTSVLGATGTSGFIALDFAPDGTFFASANSLVAPGGGLFDLDPSNGTAVERGPHGIGAFPSMAVDSAGNVFGAQDGIPTGRFYSIDSITGAATFIGDLMHPSASQGMDFNSADELFLLTATFPLGDTSFTPALLRVDTGTGLATVVGPFTMDLGSGPEPTIGRIEGIDVSFAADGTLYMITAIDGVRISLLTVDTSTGAATLVTDVFGPPVFGPPSFTNFIAPAPLTWGPAAPVVTFSDVVVAGDCPQSFGIVRTWTATDGTGLSSSCEQVITVVDTTPPVITCPPDLVLECEGPDGVSILNPAIQAFLAGALATDACDPNPVITNNSQSVSTTVIDFEGLAHGTVLTNQILGITVTGGAILSDPFSVPGFSGSIDLGPGINTLYATLGVPPYDTSITPGPVPIPGTGPLTIEFDSPVDNISFLLSAFAGVVQADSFDSGASLIATESFAVSPALVQLVSLSSSGASSIVLTYFPAGTTVGSCCFAINDLTFDSVASLGLGTTEVTFTATDACGNSSSCTSTITIVDTTPPTVDCTLEETLLWPPDHDLVSVGFAASVSDVCDPEGSANSLTVEVWSDETEVPEQGDGSGNHAPDAKGLDSDLRLRSERRGTEDGRVYLIISRAVDASGNVGVSCCTVVVPHDQSVASIDSVLAQAGAAAAFCADNGGSPPPGFTQHGLSDPIGPKQ